eukprot:TRINITY_DN4047_c0_g1_i1.p1 TRINITY_DN4047_c0_g1~~TRINITY_DN4047_c0_g1_i1.p1  ORF type:complete len:382 (-),score=68.63 TRINITY_DN4047_c0_g1_i1:209-1354(-)
MEAYLEENGIPTLFKELVIQLIREKPKDPLPFLVQAIQSRIGGNIVLREEKLKDHSPAIANNDNSNNTVENYDLSIQDSEPSINSIIDGEMRRKSMSNRRRGAIASEPVDPNAVGKCVIPKTSEQRDRLEASLTQNIMFNRLDEEELRDVFDAMFEVSHSAGTTIINQGDEGDNFYVIDEGECEIFVSKEKGTQELVAKVVRNGSFGELALMYGSPRAATVKAVTDVRLWAIDRASYRGVLMATTLKKRKLYESFLEKVPILQTLTKWERLIVADALEPVTFRNEHVILREGEPGDKFYIILEGTCVVYAKGSEVARLGVSDYFGEIALLFNRPRAATVIAAGTVKTAVMDRERFNRVMGACEDLLRRNIPNYNKYMAEQI